jgi:hypothetical protein
VLGELVRRSSAIQCPQLGMSAAATSSAISRIMSA